MMLYKNTFIKIKKSLGRYISILIIVLVGVGFYAGIQSSAPDVAKVADDYYRHNKLMDVKVVSTLGLTTEDVDSLEKLKNVAQAVPAYSLDVLNEKRAVRIHSLEEKVNIITLKEGRMPRNDNESIADASAYKVGDIIKITSDESENLKNLEYKVVGTVESVMYIADDYGSTTVGDGKLYSYFYVPKSNFTLDTYTEIYLKAQGADNIAAYSEAYDHAVASLRNELVDVKGEREDDRFNEIKNKANNEIFENESKLVNEKNKGKLELQKAKKELDDASAKLKSGKQEIQENEKLLDNTIKERNTEFEAGQKQIDDGWKALDASISAAGINREEIKEKMHELAQGIAQMKSQLALIPVGSPEYNSLNEQIKILEEKFQALYTLSDAVDELGEQEKKLAEGKALFTAETDKAKAEIAKGKREISENEEKLSEGYSEYYVNLKRFEAEITDGENKISEAKTKVSEIEKTKWYITDRSDISGYDQLKGGIQVIRSVAAVFPFFFILIVVLMTSNSMSRMIAEERGELGTLTSLGYKDKHIIATYLLYVLSASGIGAAAGYFIGCRLIPPLIYANFKYTLPPLVIDYNLPLFAGIMLISLGIMTLVTVVGCVKELKEKPAYLLRPLPPKHGQKILLERAGIIWNHLSFTWKITMRNMFRYKKRAFMAIVGVAGCTSFLLVGFGLRDSMDGVAQKQYSDIFRYDNMIILKDETDLLKDDISALLKAEKIENPLLIKQSAFKSENKNKSLDSYLVVPQDESGFERFYSLKSTVTGKAVRLSRSEAVITQRLAKELGINKGDSLTVKDLDNNIFTVKISDIAENYISHYIYMLPSAYKAVFGIEPLYNTVLSNSSADKTELAENLIQSGYVINAVFSEDIMQQAVESNDSLNNIIILLIVVASLLALIVLYNLTAINISERTREIATLKVLGFRDTETNAYIYREALVLTVISIGIGLLLGVVLHRFVIGVLESGFMGLIHKINWLSFAVSALFTLVFSVVMQFVTYFKLKTVDMIESLKAVE